MSNMNLPDPDALLASGFAARIKTWAEEIAAQRGVPLERDAVWCLQRAAWSASKATSDGHVCALLSDIAAESSRADIGSDLAAWRRLLFDSGVVGTPDCPGACPLILDGEDRLYLHKYLAFEKSLANRLLQADWAPQPPSAATCDLLDRLFRREGDAGNEQHADWQKIAAALALLRPITIISGGPGTGKTTTVANILACLLADDPLCRIALAAPTGKAAARMLEALRSRAQSIPSELAARFPQESFTVHRLLGVTPTAGVFRHNARNPLPIDVLVVDEASMLDLALAARLFDAVPRTARIILLGDKDQLAAVEAGAVFSELSANPALSDDVAAAVAEVARTPKELITPPAEARGQGVADSTVWLTRNYRFDKHSPIGQLASLIVGGNAQQTIEWLQQEAHGVNGIGWNADLGDDLPAAALEHAIESYLPYVTTVRQSENDPLAVFAAFDRFRVLCAVRNGPRGVAGINQALAARLSGLLPASDAQSPWHVGRPVIVLRNDYTLKLFNGDIGIALRDENGRLMVMFPDREQGWRAVGIARLPEHDSAWAMTVHRAQGSEFANVMAVLPGRENRVVTRELLYTAVTRTREGLMLVGSPKAVGDAVRTRTVRLTGLADRLAGR